MALNRPSCNPDNLNIPPRPPPPFVDVTENEQRVVMLLFEDALKQRLKQKGFRPFFDHLHGMGVIEEELDELKEASHRNHYIDMFNESLDLAVAAFWQAVTVSRYK